MNIKEHIEKHKEAYIVGTLSFATFTALIMRGVAKQHIGRDVIVTADRVIHVVADRSVVTGNVFSISSRRKGGLSWVVRCLENGLVYTSQRKAALALEVPETDISRQINGIIDNARGYHFERICIAA